MSEKLECAVPSERYSQELLLTFSGEEYRHFLATGGQALRPRLARSLELAALEPGMRVLDIGCGRGEAVLHALWRGAEVVGVDYAGAPLRLTAHTLKLASSQEQGRVALGRADATRLPFADGAFDRVLMLDLVEHLHPWQLRLTLGEARRVLRSGGYLVLHSVPNRWALRYGYPLLRLFWPHLPASPRSPYEEEVHVNEQDLLSLREGLRQAGLAAAIWLEDWTTVQAVWQTGRRFADALREEGYPLLRRPALRALAALLMRTPLRLILANDLYAIAWPAGREAPPVARVPCLERLITGLA
ncbi:MAG: class I SAM-dependent methyltransferase [Anaerolineae bacterium]